jgi:hypothetical protein
MFVYLEDAWHPIGDDEHTECGLVVPPLETWVREVPEGETIHCGPLASVDEKPKAKPKAKKQG